MKNKFRIFSIIAAVIFFVIALLNSVMLVVNVALPIFTYGGTILMVIEFLIYTLGTTLLPELFIIALEIVAAILLLVRPKSKAVFVPLGLLTFTFFLSPLSTVGSFLKNMVFGYMGPDFMANNAVIANAVLPLVYLVISLVFAAVLTVIFLVLSKKVKNFILMIVMAVIYIVGVFVADIFGGASIVLNLVYAPGGAVYMVSSVINLIISSFRFIPVVLTAIGMIITRKSDNTAI